MAQHLIQDVIANRRVRLVSANASIHACLALLRGSEVDALVVSMDSGPCGVVRFFDFETSWPADTSLPIATIMKLAGPAVPSTMTAEDALRVMHACQRPDLPVMNTEGTLVSLVSASDLKMGFDVPVEEDLVA